MSGDGRDKLFEERRANFGTNYRRDGRKPFGAIHEQGPRESPGMNGVCNRAERVKAQEILLARGVRAAIFCALEFEKELLWHEFVN
jgi:hypothetical protein